MTRFLLVFVLTVVVAIQLPAITLAIVDGLEADEGQFPSIVRLSVRSSSGAESCGGCLISKEWILTAAHCLCAKTEVKSADIFFGSNLREPSISNRRYVLKENMICHKEYRVFGHKNDIALIYLNNPVTFSDAVQPALLPERQTQFLPADYKDYEFTAAGWGLTSSKDGTPSTERLRYLPEMKGINTTVCRASIPIIGKHIVNEEKSICTVHEDNASICFGDSGGPLYGTSNEGDDILMGIVSTGKQGDCGSGLPDVFTRVDYFLDWIKNITKLDI